MIKTTNWPSHWIEVPSHIAEFICKGGAIEEQFQDYSNVATIYGIECYLTGKVYIGESSDTLKRLIQHLVTHKGTNYRLKAAILKNGIGWFRVYIFEVVEFAPDVTKEQKRKILRAREQYYLRLYLCIKPKQLYNGGWRNNES